MQQVFRNKFFLFLFFFLAFGLCASAQGGKRLLISPNHRFFTDEKGAPFFWLGDTGWLLFSKLTRDEAETYLEDRRKKGFNVIQAMVLHTVAAVNVYGDSALVNKNVATPLTTAGKASANAMQYDYWDHVDYIIDLAAKKGMYMALVPVWGSNVKAGFVSTEQAGIYAKWLANRYKSRWNIVWLNGGDIRGTDSAATWKVLGSTLKAADPAHLVSFHPFGRTSSSEYFPQEPWMDFNMFQSGHRSYDLDTSAKEHRYGPDNYRFLQVDYNLAPTKPSFDGEPSYELIPHGLHDTTKPYWQAADVRRYAWWSVFAGGAGHTYGHNSVMQMHKPSDKETAYGSKKYWYDALNDSGARQMIYLKNLVLSKPFFERVPDQSLVAGGQGDKYNYIAATRGKRYAFLYDYTGRKFEVVMGKIEGANVLASWYNPTNGNKKSIGRFANKGIRSFDPPGGEKEGNDWVLILESLN
ncbi:glycoside hydrolase family 140 protein [Flavisolibacter nicotianae]|uniref:glycoside hydrolase family 140 protein n=1 Tax=Flavisolibacter nicotianae TaxID=2364882 RepID=UPI000EB36ECB|nr:glycoside hydrolase family 140 protein [Flavisolibacter nicotianae]